MSYHKSEWYKTGWGILIAIILLPFLVIWYIWTKTNLSTLVKSIITLVVIVFFLAISTLSSDQTFEQVEKNDQKTGVEESEQEVNDKSKTNYQNLKGFIFHTKTQDIYSYNLAGAKNINVTSMIKEGELIILDGHRERYNLDRKTEDISGVSVEYGFIPDEFINGSQASKAYSSLAFDFKIDKTAFSGEMTVLFDNSQSDKAKLVDVLKLFISDLTKVTLTGQTEASQQASNPSYKLLKEKKEAGGTVTPQIEFYLAQDRNYDQMYQFIKKRKVAEGIFYHAVFVDDEKYAVFSEYPITAMTFGEEQSKHIVATYVFNTNNGNREFTSYEKNSWESTPQIRRD